MQGDYTKVMRVAFSGREESFEGPKCGRNTKASISGLGDDWVTLC